MFVRLLHLFFHYALCIFYIIHKHKHLLPSIYYICCVTLAIKLYKNKLQMDWFIFQTFKSLANWKKKKSHKPKLNFAFKT